MTSVAMAAVTQHSVSHRSAMWVLKKSYKRRNIMRKSSFTPPRGRAKAVLGYRLTTYGKIDGGTGSYGVFEDDIIAYCRGTRANETYGCSPLNDGTGSIGWKSCGASRSCFVPGWHRCLTVSQAVLPRPVRRIVPTSQCGAGSPPFVPLYNGF